MMSFCVCGGCSAESLCTFSHNSPKSWQMKRPCLSFSLQRWTETHVFLQLGTNSKPAVASACLRPKQSDLVYFFLGTCQNPQWYLFLGCYILLLRDSCLCLTNLSARLHGVVATCGHRSHHHRFLHAHVYSFHAASLNLFKLVKTSIALQVNYHDRNSIIQQFLLRTTIRF